MITATEEKDYAEFDNFTREELCRIILKARKQIDGLNAELENLENELRVNFANNVFLELLGHEHIVRDENISLSDCVEKAFEAADLFLERAKK